MDPYDVEYDSSVEAASPTCFLFGALFFETLPLYVPYVQLGELSDRSINRSIKSCILKSLSPHDACDCNVSVTCMLYLSLISKLFSQFRELF